MKKAAGLLTSILSASIWSSEALAHSGSPYAFIHAVQHWWIEYFNALNNTGGNGHSVPELDGATGPLAVTLIVAVIGIGLERNRRKKAKQNSNS